MKLCSCQCGHTVDDHYNGECHARCHDDQQEATRQRWEDEYRRLEEQERLHAQDQS